MRREEILLGSGLHVETLRVTSEEMKDSVRGGQFMVEWIRIAYRRESDGSWRCMSVELRGARLLGQFLDFVEIWDQKNNGFKQHIPERMMLLDLVNELRPS